MVINQFWVNVVEQRIIVREYLVKADSGELAIEKVKKQEIAEVGNADCAYWAEPVEFKTDVIRL